MPDRSLSSIDSDLSEAVKARSEATKSISQLSQSVVYNTKKIDQLLAERSSIECPDTPAELEVTPPLAPVATVPPPATAKPAKGKGTVK